MEAESEQAQLMEGEGMKMMTGLEQEILDHNNKEILDISTAAGLNENDGDGHGGLNQGSAKKRRKRNRRRNKKKAEKAAAAAAEANPDNKNDYFILSKISSNDALCPILVDPPVRCSYCSSANLASVREDHVKSIEIVDSKEVARSLEVSTTPAECDPNWMGQWKNRDSFNSFETKQLLRKDLLENQKILPEITVLIENQKMVLKDPILMSEEPEIISEEDPTMSKEPELTQEESPKMSEEIEIVEEDPEISQEQEIIAEDLKVSEEPKILFEQDQNQPAEQESLSDDQKILQNQGNQAVDPEDPKISEEPAVLQKILQEEPEIVNVELQQNNPDVQELSKSSNNVAVIFRIGAAVFESQQNPSITDVSVEVEDNQVLNPRTGLVESIDPEPEEEEPLEKYEVTGEPSLGELWDNTNYTSTSYARDQDCASIHNIDVNNNNNAVEEISQISSWSEKLTGLARISSSSFPEAITASPSIAIAVPHPSIEASEGLVNLPAATLYPSSLARRAMIKRESPMLDKVAKRIVDDVITSAENMYYGNDLVNNSKVLALDAEIVENPDDMAIEQEEYEYLRNKLEPEKHEKAKEAVPSEAVGKNLISPQYPTKECSWVIDPKVIEDAVSEAHLAGKASNKSSIVKSLMNCFGNNKKQDGKRNNSTVKKLRKKD